MKRKLLFWAALTVATLSWGQTEVNMEQLFNVQDKFIDLNDPLTLKQGIAFIGDTRAPENIQEGKYQGMRVQKQRRNFMVNGKNMQFCNALMFRRAPRGSMKNHVMQIESVPRSCMMQLKPVESGKLTFCAQSSKEVANLYVSVRNGDSFKNVAVLPVNKTEKTGRKDDPWSPVVCDYTYTEGDELWIYADTSVNLFAFGFSGKYDTSFEGSEPNATAKAISRAQRK